MHCDETSLAGVHVLIVEDNDINAEVAAELLSFMGTTSERAGEPGHFSMVFMDIHDAGHGRPGVGQAHPGIGQGRSGDDSDRGADGQCLYRGKQDREGGPA